MAFSAKATFLESPHFNHAIVGLSSPCAKVAGAIISDVRVSKSTAVFIIFTIQGLSE